MALNPDKASPIFSEQNVDIPGGTKADSAYDLGLFPELGDKTRGVLVVTIILNFKFEDGESKKTPGTKLTWTPQGKTDFMNGVKAVCLAVWAEKWRITTTNTIPMANDVGVIFDIQTAERMGRTAHSHWNVTTTMIDAGGFATSSVRGCGGWVSNGETQFDSEDLTAVSKGGPTTQRGAVHEFGHMLGLPDEYPAANDNTNFTSDLSSIMHSCETVRERHYVFFADWIGRQWNNKTSLVKPTDWKVNGSINIQNARI